MKRDISMQERIQRMEKGMEETWKKYCTPEAVAEWQKVEDDIACPHCGRVILCGVDTLCKQPDCGIKQRRSKNEA